jgi:hypothetical protein
MHRPNRSCCGIALLLATLLAATAAHASTTDPGTSSNGRYQGVEASENAVWILDTRTGKVRKCTQDFADQTPVCSKQSN